MHEFLLKNLKRAKKFSFHNTKKGCPCGNSLSLMIKLLGLECVLQHDEAVGSQVDGELLLSLDLLCLRRDGLGVVVVLIVRIACEHRLGGQFLQTKATQVDVGLLGLGTGITEFHEELTGLGVEDHALSIVHILHGLDDIGGITLEFHAVTIIVVA